MKKALNLLLVIFTLILLLGNVFNIKQVNGETTSHVHFVCGGSCSHNGSHSNITFTALPSDFKGGLLNAGNYYLTQNIYLTQPITFSKDAIVNLCFNGYKITAPNEGTQQTAFLIDTGKGAENVTLNLTTCSNSIEHTFSILNNVWYPFSSGSKKLTGGVIVGKGGYTSNSTTYGGAIYIYGNNTLNLFGVKVAGASANRGVLYGLMELPQINQ